MISSFKAVLKHIRRQFKLVGLPICQLPNKHFFSAGFKGKLSKIRRRPTFFLTHDVFVSGSRKF